MLDPRDEITRIIATAEAAAYERGWQDACNAMLATAQRMAADTRRLRPDADSVPAEPRRGRPSGKAIDIVAESITAHPGLKGVDVVKAVQTYDPAIPERTVRTCLRRLRANKVIWQRNGLWYPKNKTAEITQPENGNGEAVGSPPH